MTEYINRYLENYSGEDRYPWHMPGHKRQDVFEDDFWSGMFRRDFTEAKNLDDLHEPKLFIKDSLVQMKEIYKTAATYMMVNGATGGILAALASCAPQGAHVLLGRNCHKSVYHAVSLLHLRPDYVVPELLPGTRISGSITPEQMRVKLKEMEVAGTRPAAVVLTSPTYEGVISDIRGILAELSPYGIPLIVDEAHGAHLPFVEDKKSPCSAVSAGADLVIQSTHKTLPALTQTALLHVNNENMIPRIERYLNVFQTSSPSYVLVQSIEKAVVYAATHPEAWGAYRTRLFAFRETCRTFRKLQLLEPEQACYAYDVGKLVVMLPAERNGCIDGMWLADMLAERYHQIVEMAGDRYVIAMTSVADGDAAYEWFYAALAKIDAKLCERDDATRASDDAFDEIPHLPRQQMPPGLAWEQQSVRIRLTLAEGRVAADDIYAYPPGTAVLCSGEVIDRESIDDIVHMVQARLNMVGIEIRDGEVWVEVLAEHGEGNSDFM